MTRIDFCSKLYTLRVSVATTNRLAHDGGKKMPESLQFYQFSKFFIYFSEKSENQWREAITTRETQEKLCSTGKKEG